MSFPYRRRSRYLKCFYCGKRTSTPNDGRVHEFECASCDATNYLDENGEITDPPVATTATYDTSSPMLHATGLSSGQTQLNSPLGSQPTDSAPKTVFCNTCLKNQHLFVASLAQYFPDDPNHPDMPELEHNYFRFRQGLEKRYPQVCADCEPKVLEAIRQAGYTAKTDHLRRMVDYSRQVRLTRPTSVDLANSLGRWLWWAGFLFQILWQVAVVADILVPGASAASDGGSFGDDMIVDDVFSSPTGAQPAVLDTGILGVVLRWLLVRVYWLQATCVVSTVAGCWWNPFFVQTIRGFTKPVIGIGNWYAFQVANILVRVMLARISTQDSNSSNNSNNSNSSITATTIPLPPTVLGAHAFAALFGLYSFFSGPKSIRKDMRPLFGKIPDAPLVAGPLPTTAEQRTDDQRRGLETLSDVLDEISTTPTRHHASKSVQEDLYDTEGWDGWQPSPSPPHKTLTTTDGSRFEGFNSYSVGPQRGSSNFELSTLQISGSSDQLMSQSQQTDPYSDEMDWQPTQPTATEPVQSQYRAFNSYDMNHNRFNDPPSSSARAFSHTPVEDDRGPFWYKVPQAPTSIAHRVMNPPNAPRLRPGRGSGTADGTAGTASFFKRSDGLPPLNLHSKSAAASSVEFAQPSFFAESTMRNSKDEDESRNLSDLFSQSFKLDTGSGEGGLAGQRRSRRRSLANGNGHRTAPLSAPQPPHQADEPSPAQRVFRLILVLGSFLFLAALQLPDRYHEVLPRLRPYGAVVETASVGLCAVLAASLTAESVTRWRLQAMARQMGNGNNKSQGESLWPSFAGTLLGLAGMGLAGWMGFQMWQASEANEPRSLDAAHLLSSETLDQQQPTQAAEPHSPWQWWQLALLHGTVAIHQIWNMA